MSGGAGIAGLAIGGLVGYGLAPKDEGGGGDGSHGRAIKLAAAYPLTGWGAGDGAQMK